MNVIKTVEEIGLLQTSINISEVCGSNEIENKVGAVMPLPTSDIESRVEKLAKWLANIGKEKMMFLTPEIALFDRIPKYMNNVEGIVVVPSDMDAEAKERLSGNLPVDMNVSLLTESDFPTDFRPQNGIIVACGYISGERWKVLPATYRMLEHYHNFGGKVVFLPFVNLEIEKTYKEWIEISPYMFKKVWREDE